MSRSIFILVCLVCATSSWAADIYTSRGLKDVYFGEALYHAYQGDWFQSIARLDTELGQHGRVDEPGLDPLYFHLNQAQFGVGDFELGYRMHLRAGRAITAVIEGNVEEPVRNDAIYRLARLYFQKNQPEDALHALERVRGVVPPTIRDDVAFLRGQILLSNGRFSEATQVYKDLQKAKGYEGFAGYNLGIALLKEGKEQEGRESLNRAGQILADTPAAMAIKDKANLVLGYKLLDEKVGDNGKLLLERVRLTGPFSNKALLGSGWADASLGRYERALVPWTILAEREVTDAAVQEALLAVPHAYGKLNIFGKAAVLYGKALDLFGKEVEKLGASITSVQEGKFLQALAREELRQDSDWVVKLRSLPQAPETYYLLELMASHDFQESLKNYLDLHELQTKLDVWERDLVAFQDMIAQRKAYYQPLLPDIDRKFRELDSQIRLRTEQRIRVEKRLHAMLTAPRPDYLTTGEERIAKEKLDSLEQGIATPKIPSPLVDPLGPKGKGKGGGGSALGEAGAISGLGPPPPPPPPPPGGGGGGGGGGRGGGCV
jgi:tetratricopeptide (TPR) repeat protein